MASARVGEYKQKVAEAGGVEVLTLSGKLKCHQGTRKRVSDTWEGRSLLLAEVTAV